MSDLTVINEELDKDIQTGILDIFREYEYVIDECAHTGEYELCIIWNNGMFGEYLYNTKTEANTDIQVLVEMGFNIKEA